MLFQDKLRISIFSEKLAINSQRNFDRSWLSAKHVCQCSIFRLESARQIHSKHLWLIDHWFHNVLCTSVRTVCNILFLLQKSFFVFFFSASLFILLFVTSDSNILASYLGSDIWITCKIKWDLITCTLIIKVESIKLHNARCNKLDPQALTLY